MKGRRARKAREKLAGREKGKRKKEGTESSPLPVSSRFIFVFALSQFSGPDCLGAWNRLVAGGIVMPGVLSRRLSCHAKRAPSAEAARENPAYTETKALIRFSCQLPKLSSLAFMLRRSRCWHSRRLASQQEWIRKKLLNAVVHSTRK